MSSFKGSDPLEPGLSTGTPRIPRLSARNDNKARNDKKQLSGLLVRQAMRRSHQFLHLL